MFISVVYKEAGAGNESPQVLVRKACTICTEVFRKIVNILN